MSDRIFARATDLVWRSGPDRILLHRVDSDPETASTELTGPVAFLWLALDEPATTSQLVTRLAEADLAMADLDGHIAQLVDARLIGSSPVVAPAS